MAVRYVAIAAGLVYVLVGLMGFVPGINVPGPPDAPDLAVDSFYGYLMGLIPVLNTTFGLIPIFGHDVWLHAGTAAIAAYFGWFHRLNADDRIADRVGHRTGHHDSVADRAEDLVGRR